jgi:hypothetical protein
MVASAKSTEVRHAAHGKTGIDYRGLTVVATTLFGDELTRRVSAGIATTKLWVALPMYVEGERKCNDMGRTLGVFEVTHR